MTAFRQTANAATAGLWTWNFDVDNLFASHQDTQFAVTVQSTSIVRTVSKSGSTRSSTEA